MSAHDKGTFGQLMASARLLGARKLVFDCDLEAADEDQLRWQVTAYAVGNDPMAFGHGRTGEEALRDLVDAIGLNLALLVEHAS